MSKITNPVQKRFQELSDLPYGTVIRTNTGTYYLKSGTIPYWLGFGGETRYTSASLAQYILSYTVVEQGSGNA